MAFEPFNLGQVFATAEGIKAARAQATTDRLREQYLGLQIKGAEQDQARQQRQDAIVLGKEKASQVDIKASQILAAQNPKNYVEQNEPVLAEQLSKAGVDWATLDDDGVRQYVTQMQNRARQELGVAPVTEQQVGGFQTLQQGGKIIASAAPKQDTPDAITQRWKQEVANGYKGSLLDYQKELKAAGRTQVSVNTKQETEEAKAVGKALGQQYVELQKAGVAADAKLGRLDRLDGLLAGVATGKLTPKMTELAAYADALGIKLDPNLDAKQGAEALIGEMTLQARNPAGGAGMPGAMSDADREFLKTLNPSLAQTPGGRKLVIETQRKLAKRDQQVAKMARAYRTANGSLEGFAEELQQWSAENPLFESESAVAGAAGAADFIYVPGQGLQPSR